MPTDPPRTPRREVTETRHGETVVDPYRWLEGDGDEVADWVAAQNDHADDHLRASPTRDRLRPRFEELAERAAFHPVKPAGDRLFQRVAWPDDDLPRLTVRERDAGDGEAERRVLADPNGWSDDGTVALNWHVPSPDGDLVAYGVTTSGDEQYDVRVADAETGDVVDELPATGRTSAVSFAWYGDGFYYVRTGDPDGDGQLDKAVAYHRLGDAPADDDELDVDLAADTWPALHADGDRLVVALDHGWERTDLYRLADGDLDPLVTGRDAIIEPQVRGDRAYVRTTADAPNFRVAAVDLADPDGFDTVVPEQSAVADDFAFAGDHLVVHYERDVTSELAVYTLAGDHVADVDLPGPGTVSGLDGSTDGDAVFFRFESFDQPPTVYRYAVGDGLVECDRPDVSVDADLDVSQEWFESADDTEVPAFVVARSDVERDGDNPALLYGYGGFGKSMTPSFDPYVVPFLERGGVYAVANLRGGGEFGEEWHHAARKATKQRTFDDFVAAAEHLVDRGHTRPERLGIAGRSNGGLTVGAAITRRPDLFAACLCVVPLLDMLRFHEFLLGASWTPEYGDPDDPDAFEYVRDYSPYHNVAGEEYPATLFKTATSDSRVHPAHARKMTALLQERDASDSPILLREEQETGHGVGKPAAMEAREKLDEWTFLFDRLGVDA
ncbi:prolyl oligopeptidase family serine peptidase [Halomicrococcus gelatinilyticus]|uniref:prolyl oligopeptidase family serine peptidase n=1 Tax=Halomicrococcus gelatinilyticus TaxID=1702103 RepID=UPI002E0ED2FA